MGTTRILLYMYALHMDGCTDCSEYSSVEQILHGGGGVMVLQIFHGLLNDHAHNL